jgi:hypothetical protein
VADARIGLKVRGFIAGARYPRARSVVKSLRCIKLVYSRYRPHNGVASKLLALLQSLQRGNGVVEPGHFQASRSDRRMVAVGNAHGMRGFLVGVAERRTNGRGDRRVEGFVRIFQVKDSGVAPRRTRNSHRIQGLKPLATLVPSLRDFGEQAMESRLNC